MTSQHGRPVLRARTGCLLLPTGAVILRRILCYTSYTNAMHGPSLIQIMFLRPKCSNSRPEWSNARESGTTSRLRSCSNTTGWWSCIVISALASMNEVNLRWARLALRWATVSRFNSRCRTFISVCNRPAIQGQLSLPSLQGRKMSTSFGWEGKGRYGSFR